MVNIELPIELFELVVFQNPFHFDELWDEIDGITRMKKIPEEIFLIIINRLSKYCQQGKVPCEHCNGYVNRIIFDFENQKKISTVANPLPTSNN